MKLSTLWSSIVCKIARTVRPPAQKREINKKRIRRSNKFWKLIELKYWPGIAKVVSVRNVSTPWRHTPNPSLPSPPTLRSLLLVTVTGNQQSTMSKHNKISTPVLLSTPSKLIWNIFHKHGMIFAFRVRCESDLSNCMSNLLQRCVKIATKGTIMRYLAKIRWYALHLWPPASQVVFFPS